MQCDKPPNVFTIFFYCITAVLIQLSDLPFTGLIPSDVLPTIENQFQRLRVKNWKEDDSFEATGVPTNTVQFLTEIRKHTNAAGEFDFQKVANHFLDCCLCIPLSNAYIECIFSMAAYAKNKWQNRMTTATLDAILTIKCHFYAHKYCCKQLVVTKGMLSRFTQNMYNHLRKEGKNQTDNVQPDNVNVQPDDVNVQPDDTESFLELCQIIDNC